MKALGSIFKRIREEFTAGRPPDEVAGYQPIYSPFSIGFTHEDFLFLDTNTASENAHKYVDELFEFSQIANTIPAHNEFWVVSESRNDLFSRYKDILRNLKLLDTDTLTIEMLYEHPIFPQALGAIDTGLQGKYLPFYSLSQKIREEIVTLKQSLSERNQASVNLEIQLKEDNLVKITESWTKEGQKQAAEEQILGVVRVEFKRFLQRLDEVKGQLGTSIRTHAGSNVDFGLTFCAPNNLYASDKLAWKKISVEQAELQTIKAKTGAQEYASLLDNTGADLPELESLSFELLFVDVIRAWYDDSILASPFWDLSFLDESEVQFPRVSSKLIFIRNVDVTLKQPPPTGPTGTATWRPRTLGPFVATAKRGGNPATLRLNSVNTALQIPKKSVISVSSKLATEPRRPVEAKEAIAHKRRQFIALAPRLQRKLATRTLRTEPAVTRDHRVRPGPTRLIPPRQRPRPGGRPAPQPATLTCRFTFVAQGAEAEVAIEPEHIEVRQGGALVADRVFAQSPHMLAVNLPVGADITLQVRHPDYEEVESRFRVTPVNPSDKVVDERITLTKLPPIAVDDFQLIGVIAKLVPPFPNPIPGAKYM